MNLRELTIAAWGFEYQDDHARRWVEEIIEKADGVLVTGGDNDAIWDAGDAVVPDYSVEIWNVFLGTGAARAPMSDFEVEPAENLEETARMILAAMAVRLIEEYITSQEA
jgi:hypothetical protein